MEWIISVTILMAILIALISVLIITSHQRDNKEPIYIPSPESEERWLAFEFLAIKQEYQDGKITKEEADTKMANAKRTGPPWKEQAELLKKTYPDRIRYN